MRQRTLSEIKADIRKAINDFSNEILIEKSITNEDNDIMTYYLHFNSKEIKEFGLDEIVMSIKDEILNIIKNVYHPMILEVGKIINLGHRDGDKIYLQEVLLKYYPQAFKKKQWKIFRVNID